MDYRSPFELRQLLFEEARAAQIVSPDAKSKKSKYSSVSPSDSAASAAPAPPVISASAASGPGLTSSTELPDDPTALVREVPGAENLKALTEALEREEAVQRHMENHNFSLEESATYIMTHGSAGQRISYFEHIRNSLVGLSPRQLSKMLSILLDSMWTQDPELQCSAPVCIYGFIGLLDDVTALVVLETTKTMLAVKMVEVRVRWGTLLVQLLEYLPVERLTTDIIPLALKKSEHVQPQDQRELSCRVLGSVCQQLPSEKVEALILPRALELCQDTNVGVRQNMCQQLYSIAHSLGIDKAKAKVAPDLFELLNDEERAVSRAAFSCLLDLVEFFGPAYRKERLFPIIKSFISDPPKEVVSLLIGEFGRFLDEIKSDISEEEDVVLFAQFFSTAAARQDEDARRNCAYNFPAVVASLPISVFPTHLASVLNALASDSCTQVRQSIAAGLHELVALLNTSAVEFIEQPFFSLLNDCDPSVRASLFRTTDLLFDCFVKQKRGSSRMAFFNSVCTALLRCVSERSTDWRTMRYFIATITTYVAYIDEMVLAEKVVPLVLGYMKYGANILKDNCATVVLCIMCRIENPSVKAQIFSRINNDFARSSSCYQRQAYFCFVRAARSYFSRRCVRERMLECCLELQRDSVMSVRLTLVQTLPVLSQVLRKTNPGALEEEFNTMVNQMTRDESDEVRSAAVASKQIAEKSCGRGKADQAALDQEDERREKEELVMLEMAKETDKAERRAKLRDLLRSEREKDLGDMPPPSSGSGRKPYSGLAATQPLRKMAPKTSGTSTTGGLSLPRLAMAKQANSVGIRRRTP